MTGEEEIPRFFLLFLAIQINFLSWNKNKRTFAPIIILLTSKKDNRL